MKACRMSIKFIIVEQITQIAREQGKILAPLKDDLELAESGLDSLGFAVLVARLEDKLGFDPFTAAETASFPVTFGDFIKVYENGSAREPSRMLNAL
jgi:acyl carrier protein